MPTKDEDREPCEDAELMPEKHCEENGSCIVIRGRAEMSPDWDLKFYKIEILLFYQICIHSLRLNEKNIFPDISTLNVH